MRAAVDRAAAVRRERGLRRALPRAHPRGRARLGVRGHVVVQAPLTRRAGHRLRRRRRAQHAHGARQGAPARGRARRCSTTRSRAWRRVAPEVRILCGAGAALRGPRASPRARRAGRTARWPGWRRRCADAGGADALLLGVDLPLVTVDLLAALAGAGADADAVVPAGPRGPEPLCALYRAACRGPGRAPPRRRRAQDDELLARRARARRSDGAALAAFGDPSGSSRNVNAPEDYRRVAP